MQDKEKCEVLFIEDNINDAELTLLSLKKHSISGIRHLRDGVEALDFLFQKGDYVLHSDIKKIRLIILDIKLPRVNGLEVLKILKNNESTRHIPVVVFSSSNEENDVICSYTFGANSYIVKPLEFAKYDMAIGDMCWYWINVNRLPD